MTVDYHINQPISGADAADLFNRSGIRRPTNDVDRIDAMFKNADITISAWDGQRLVGVARALTDYRYCCYLSDLAVDSACHKQGVGRELVSTLRAHLGPEVTLILLSAPGAMEYYPKIGFEPANNAFIIHRER